MIALAWILAIALAVLLAAQAVPTIGYARALRRDGRPRLPDEACPKAAAILCLRGDDPFLRDCLEGLLSQDYPDYDVRIVVDQREDPAWAVVEDVVQRRGAANVVVEPLTERRETCSLKGSSIVQAVSRLDDSHQVVALLDADTIPHPTWLRELVAPLVDPEIGVASGNRWYMPSRATWGALVRYIWNAAGVVQMYWNRITWGGSVAMKAEIARHPEMLDTWKTAVSTDSVILAVIRRLGYRTEFVPSLMMINRESCTLGGFFRWVQRQMVVVRLYHAAWLPVMLHGVLMSLAPAAAVALLIATLLTGDYVAAGVMLVAAIGYWLGMAWLVMSVEAAVRHVVRRRNEATDWITPWVAVKFFLALPLTQAVYTTALVKANFMRIVKWRGVTYRVDGPRQVRLIEYRPFRSERQTTDSVASL